MSYSLLFSSSARLFSRSCKCLVFTALTPHQPMIRLTRWYRERFEINDIREANIYCGTNDCEIEIAEGVTDGQSRSEEGNTREKENPQTSRASRKEGMFFTWKLPPKLLFSYSTIPNRPTAKRQPNPFAPSSRPRTMSIQKHNRGGLGMSPITEEPMQTRVMRPMPSLGDGELRDRSNDRGWGREEQEYNDLASSPRVAINPPHPPWDDNSLPDQPYENPYYTLPVKDALWLPINPIGTLNLDMTVTMNVALTSEPGAGHLGPLGEGLTSIGSVLSGLTADLESGISISGDEISINEVPPDGAEEIELTPTNSPRVHDSRNDEDVSGMDQQSDLPRATRPRPKTSGSATSRNRSPGADLLTGRITRLPLGLSPPGSPPAPKSAKSDNLYLPPSLLTGSLRSLSAGPLLKAAGPADKRTHPRRASMDEGRGFSLRRPSQTSPPRRPSLIQAHSTLSIGQNSFLSPPPTGIGSRFVQPSIISQVSAQSVAVQEALNEETEVLQRSHILQQQEAEKQSTPRSRWTSWAFKQHK